MTADITVLTVTIPGREQFLWENIASVTAQSPKVRRHLICVHPAGPNAEEAQAQYIAAKNDLLKAVDTEWIAVLNDDDYWLPNHVEQVCSECDNADVVYTYDAGGSRPRVDINGWPWHRIMTKMVSGNFIDGNCLIRVSKLLKVGGFQVPDVPYEDWGLWLRMLNHGARFRCVPKETYVYRVDTPGRISPALT